MSAAASQKQKRARTHQPEVSFFPDEASEGGRQPLSSQAAVSSRSAMRKHREQLPIFTARDSLIEAVRRYDNLVIVGETGSGKTTQLPQYLLEAGFSKRGVVGITQPRRVAAVTVATRVAEEMGTKLGERAGYTIRFEDRSSPQTEVKYLTDGMLLREAVLDPLLQRYSVIILDEAHERSLNTDVLFGLVKKIQRQRLQLVKGQQQEQLLESAVRQAGGLQKKLERRRKNLRPLKVICMSATLDAEAFSKFFNDAPVLYVSGRMHPVQVYYTSEPEEDYVEAAVATVLQIHSEDNLRMMSEALEEVRDMVGTNELPPHAPDQLQVQFQQRQQRELILGPDSRKDSVDDSIDPINAEDRLAALQRERYLRKVVAWDHKQQSRGPLGDILVFLTGQEEIVTAAELLHERMQRLRESGLLVPELLIRPLYSALAPNRQLQAFEPTPQGQRKVIISTNIAETSVTIPGIRYVVDSGMVKARHFSAKTGADCLVVVPVAKAEAWQRSGRAGRVEAGVCYRLYTEESFLSLPESITPEILRCDMCSVVLQLKALGIHDVLSFEFMSRPPRATLLHALERLYGLGCLDSRGALTKEGRLMAPYPLVPQASKALITSANDLFGCSSEMLTLVSMLSVESLFVPAQKQPGGKGEEGVVLAKRRYGSLDGDHVTYLNIHQALTQSTTGQKKWCELNGVNYRNLQKVQQIRDQLLAIFERQELREISCNDPSSRRAGEDRRTAATDGSLKEVRRAMVTGYFMNTARRQPDRTYRTLFDQQVVHVHPSSVLSPANSGGNRHVAAAADTVLFDQLLHTTRPYMKDLSVIELSWLPELVPAYFQAAVSRVRSASNGLNQAAVERLSQPTPARAAASEQEAPAASSRGGELDGLLPSMWGRRK